MFRGVSVAMLAVGLSCAASPAFAQKEFRGFAEVEKGINCAAGVAGRDLLVRFTPANIAGNGPSTQLNLFAQSNAQGYRIDGQIINTFTVGTLAFVTSGSGISSNPIQIRRLRQTPAPITAATENIIMQVQIKGFDFDTDCIATLNLVLTEDF
jgi:hypothetical protein